MKVIIYTDGSARSNPGRGGYGAVLKYTNPAGKTFTSELSRGYAKTTNNRMELMAVIVALEALNRPCEVEVHSDSQYVVNAFNKHWIDGWKNEAGGPPTSSLSRTAICGSACSPQRANTKWSSSGLRATPAMSSMSAATSLPPRRPTAATSISTPALTRATCNGVFARFCVLPRYTRPVSQTTQGGHMLRIATIGTSMITDDFIQVVNANDQAAFVGTLSRDANRGTAFTAERGGERNFTSLDELAVAADVDAVYIGSPNALHYEQALACIAGGKHVIVEKPFCATEAQALEVFRAAEAAGVVALEAMRPLHDPAFHAIEDALGEIAPIRRASLRFGKYSSRYNEILAGRATNIFDCNMASGSLMDIGVYAVEPMVEIFGMPSGLTSMTTLLDPTTRQLTHGPIDGCGSILASYGGGRISVELAHSKITNDLLPSQIEGERGTIQIDHLSTPRNVRIDYRGDVVRGSATEAPREQGDNGRVLDLPKSSNTMEYELTDFITAIGSIDNVKEEIWETPAGRHELGHYRDVTLVSLRIMDAVRQQAGITFPADAGKQA